MKRIVGKTRVFLGLSCRAMSFLALTFPFFAFTHANASTYVPLDDEIYPILERLEAEGIIKSGLLTLKPLSRDEVRRLIQEAERNSEGKGIFIQSLVNSLKERFEYEPEKTKYIKPIDTFYIKYIYRDSDANVFNYNNEGDDYKKGLNLRTGFSSRVELGRVSFYINAEYANSEDKNRFIVKKAYGVLRVSGIDIQVGKDSLWWGPGYHGSILLSNNPKPMPLVKISNPEPVLLPGPLKHLGPFKFAFFVAKLEKERIIPEPYLWGMRFDFKPTPYVEVGLHRTALLGGKGRSEDLKTWLKSFLGVGEHEARREAGDQRAGLDVKLTIPFELQPLQIYFEVDGEDSAGGIPLKRAYLAGVYLPRILNFDRVSFRGEYATTYVRKRPNVWYNHHIYRDGYRYYGKIIGHHMGTDAKDIFLELSYLIPEYNGKISFSYDKEERNLSRVTKEKKEEFLIKANIRVKNGIYLEAMYGNGKIKNVGKSTSVNLIGGSITYVF